MVNTSSPSSSNNYLTEHIDMMLASHRKLAWSDLFVPDTKSIISIGEQVWRASFVLVSHWTESDPIFNYANKKALERFEYPWSGLLLSHLVFQQNRFIRQIEKDYSKKLLRKDLSPIMWEYVLSEQVRDFVLPRQQYGTFLITRKNIDDWQHVSRNGKILRR